MALNVNVTDELVVLPRRMQSTGEELANGISHGMGLVAAMIGAPVLLLAAVRHASGFFLVGTIIFIVTMLLVYFGSTLYHAWPQTRVKSFLQVMDHLAIFLLIAGTYTPFALGPSPAELNGVDGPSLAARVAITEANTSGSISSVGPFDRITARSRIFSNSRIFPCQG